MGQYLSGYFKIFFKELFLVVHGHVRIGAQSTLGGTKFLPEKYVLKISKMLEFYTLLAQKIVKISEFL